MKYCQVLTILLGICSTHGMSTASDSGIALKREKKQIDLYRIENPEEHHGHPHHHHPDAHFPGNIDHHHHGTEQTDHTHDHTITSHAHTVAVVPPPKTVFTKTEHVDTSSRQVTQTGVRTVHSPVEFKTVVHTNLAPTAPIHLHHADPLPHKAPPGYPSSDYVAYYAKYTSQGGSPIEAAHSYYRDHGGHLYNYDVEPRFAAPRYVAAAHVQGIVLDRASRALPSHASVSTELHDADIPSLQRDPIPRNYVAAGNGYHSRVNTGPVDSPSGKGPHVGYHFGPGTGILPVGNKIIRY